MKPWYVLYVMGGKEEKICELLNRMEDIRAFTPWKEVVHRKKGVRTVVKRPLFPSYIFLETTMEAVAFHQAFYEWKEKVSGILKELKYEDDISALHQEEQAYLEGLMDEEHVVRVSKGEIHNGSVMITEGPLQGYESNIIKIDRHKRRALLDVKIHDKEMRVDVSLEIVKKIES